jgi:hypothetical protein
MRRMKWVLHYDKHKTEMHIFIYRKMMLKYRKLKENLMTLYTKESFLCIKKTVCFWMDKITLFCLGWQSRRA